MPGLYLGEQFMSQVVYDQLARDQAAKAISMIQGHEQVCAERQGNIIRRLVGIEKMLGRGMVLTIGAMGSMIVALVGLLAKGASIH